jgi:aldose 1-epimerase
VTGRSATTLSLAYTHLPDAWPFDYEAWQRFALGGAQLSIEIGLRNTGTEPMPAGIGLHPYFERDATTTLTAQVDGVWLGDAEVMPTEHAAPPPPAMDLGHGPRADDLVLDNCYTGWSHRAKLAWPERRASLAIAATPPLDYLVVYSPAARHVLCVEPVSHVIDAVNLAAQGVPDTGARNLAPGETLVGTVTFTPEF